LTKSGRSLLSYEPPTHAGLSGSSSCRNSYGVIVWSSYKYSSIAAHLREFVLGKCAFIFNMC